MAKQKNTSAQVTSGPADAQEAPAAVVDAAAGQGEQPDAESPDAGAAAAVSEPEMDEGHDSKRPETVEADIDLPPPDEEPAPPEGETVPALVLSNNHLGKIGQVIQVNAAHVDALRLGGLIDPHPNAIKSATPEE